MDFKPLFLMKSSSEYMPILKTGLTAMVLSCLVLACDREKEPLPAYLTINPFELIATDPSVHGSISQKITHADMFMFDSLNNKSISLGVFELPATFPVLNTGDFSLNIDPVIKANGSSLYLQSYPFYERMSTPISLSPNEDETVDPKTRYRTDAVFEFIEDFEDSNLIFTVDRDNNPNTEMVRTTDAFEGQYSGKITLDTANPVIVAQTAGLFNLEISTAGKIFMELNYKTDVPLEFGIVSVDDQGNEVTPNFEFVVLAKDEWNKIYFDLTNLVTTSGNSRFALIFRAGLPIQDGKYTLETADILMDNVKLVHF